MTTLVTGVGLIGTAFGQWALKRHERLVYFDSEPREQYLRFHLKDAEVTIVRRDIRDLPALVETMKAHEVDTVVHTAGLIGGRVADPVYTGLQVNVGGTTNVAEAARLSGVRRFVHVSTFGVYDRHHEGTEPITEEFPIGGDAAYAASKVMNELLLKVYARQYGFELLILRPANVYGAGHFWGGSGGRAMVQRLVEAGIRGEPMRTAPARDFEYVYAKDVGHAVDLAATIALPEKHVFNIGNGSVVSFDRLIQAVRSALPDLNVELTQGNAPAGIRQPMDLSASRRYLGWEPQYTLEQGFEDYARELRAMMT